MRNVLKIYYSITDVEEYLDEMKSVTDFNDTILEPNPERLKLFHLKELYQFYTFAVPCNKMVQELKKIIDSENDLECEDVRLWVQENTLFFRNNIFSFGYSYTDEKGEHDGNFFLPQHNLYVERAPFVPVIQYWYLMKNLYFGQYHLVKEERKVEEANPNDYYYQEPNPNHPSDLDIVKQILQISQHS